MCIRDADDAGYGAGLERAIEIGGTGNVDARDVGWRGVRRNRCISAEQNRCVGIVTQCRGPSYRDDGRDNDPRSASKNLCKRANARLWPNETPGASFFGDVVVVSWKSNREGDL